MDPLKMYLLLNMLIFIAMLVYQRVTRCFLEIKKSPTSSSQPHEMATGEVKSPHLGLFPTLGDGALSGLRHGFLIKGLLGEKVPWVHFQGRKVVSDPTSPTFRMLFSGFGSSPPMNRYTV